MKPTPLNDLHMTRRGNRGPVMPKLEYSFRPASFGDFNACGSKRACGSFRDISGEYFAQEAPRAFVKEAIAFAVIAMTAAIPMFNSAAEALHLARAFAL